VGGIAGEPIRYYVVPSVLTGTQQPGASLMDRTRAGEARRKLPRGRHGLSREFVLDDQRARLLDAMVRSVADRGYAETAVADVLAGAQVSRRTFYDLFADKDDCFLQAHAAVLEVVQRTLGEAYQRPGSWPQRIAAGLAALLDLCDREPQVARVAMAEGLGVGPLAQERHCALVLSLAAYFEEGRELSPDRQWMSASTSRALAGGVVTLLRERVAERPSSAAPPPPSLRELLQCALVLYSGHQETLRFLRDHPE
jgi:AcrR family transcriptional regulator